MSYFRPGLGATSRDQRADQIAGRAGGSGSKTKPSAGLWSKRKLPAGIAQRASASKAPKAPSRPTVTPPSRNKRGTSSTSPMTTPVSVRPGATSTTSGGGSGGGGGGGYAGGTTGGGSAWASEAEIGEEVAAPAPADELEEATTTKSLSTGAKVGIAAAALLLLAPSFIK